MSYFFLGRSIALVEILKELKINKMKNCQLTTLENTKQTLTLSITVTVWSLTFESNRSNICRKQRT